jgi:hypothetical protein
LLDEFTRLTGYNRKYAVRLLSGKPVKEVLLYPDGEAVKLKPEKRRLANRKGKRVYTGEAIASPRLIWAFFWYKCGRTCGSADTCTVYEAADEVHSGMAKLDPQSQTFPYSLRGVEFL